ATEESERRKKGTRPHGKTSVRGHNGAARETLQARSRHASLSALGSARDRFLVRECFAVEREARARVEALRAHVVFLGAELDASGRAAERLEAVREQRRADAARLVRR